MYKFSMRKGIHLPYPQRILVCSKFNCYILGYNLYKSTKAFKEKRYIDSVYYETFALSLSMMIKFHANKIMEAEHHIPTEDNIANFLKEKHKEQ